MILIERLDTYKEQTTINKTHQILEKYNNYKENGTLRFIEVTNRPITITEKYYIAIDIFDTTMEKFVTEFGNANYDKALKHAEFLLELSHSKQGLLDSLDEENIESKEWIQQNRDLDLEMMGLVEELILANTQIINDYKAMEEIEVKRQEKTDELCTKYPEWKTTECRSVANKKIWIGMTYEMLIEVRGEPDHKNPSNYGYGIDWQWCWNNHTPMCIYDINDDGVVDAYN